MKINRLLEITTMLLNHKSVTAAELARRFGVSVRTIYRDIDVLSSSGVPVCTAQGTGGGISLMEHYTINRTMLSEQECQSVLFALKTLQATRYPQAEAALEKLGAIFQRAADDWIHVDFSPWGSGPAEGARMQMLKDAIFGRRVLIFEYLSAANVRTHRTLEPYRLVFKGQAWYLWGWSPEREAARLFRVSRMKNVQVSEETFEREAHEAMLIHPGGRGEPPPLVHLTLRFEAQALYRLYDDYSDGSLTDNGDGTYTVTVTFPDDGWVDGYLLSFGEQVKVLAPEVVRLRLRERIAQMAGLYAPEG